MSIFDTAAADLDGILSELGESLTIGSVVYPCTAGALSRQDLLQGDGVASELVRLFVVSRSDFQTPPAAQSLLTYQGRTYRVADVREDGATYVLNCTQRAGRRREGV